jgi:hypothetical protein
MICTTAGIIAARDARNDRGGLADGPERATGDGSSIQCGRLNTPTAGSSDQPLPRPNHARTRRPAKRTATLPRTPNPSREAILTTKRNSSALRSTRHWARQAGRMGRSSSTGVTMIRRFALQLVKFLCCTGYEIPTITANVFLSALERVSHFSNNRLRVRRSLRWRGALNLGERSLERLHVPLLWPLLPSTSLPLSA